jgi:hypothetical protein
MPDITKGRTWVSAELVTPAKLNEFLDLAIITDAAVITDKINDAAVTTDKINDAAVTTAKINDAAVTPAKLNGAQTGAAPIYGCRAWVNFDGTRNAADTGPSVNGFNVKIRASGNVASVLKTAVGDYLVTFTTAMPDANFAASVTTGGNSSNVSGGNNNIVATASTVRIITYNSNTDNSADASRVSLVILR